MSMARHKQHQHWHDGLLAWAAHHARSVWFWARGCGRRRLLEHAARAKLRLQRNLELRRLFSFPHALVLAWVLMLLWGERWVFSNRVADCAWEHWEKWPQGAQPHHLVLLADPQLVDAHSYPDQRWPLSALTLLVTDNYLRRSYRALQRQLHPDSLFFLGDLFDGGREWQTRQGHFFDPKWGLERDSVERDLLPTWRRKYGEDYWLREYRRFADIYLRDWNVGGGGPGPGQKGRKLVASLPGNHDIGFGAQVQVPVRDRFGAFFGEPNRVDVVGNHTIVSVDTVSLSAEASPYREKHDLQPIYGPANDFLAAVGESKKLAAQRELRAWHKPEVDSLGYQFEHRVRETRSEHAAESDDPPSYGDDIGPDHLPTILLTHVPLYRAPGTPCGPQRERWPPSKSAKGAKGPVVPDERNAIAVIAGYQYQNVLNEETSVKLIKSIGNVVHVFSGDDHDYCELQHSEAKDRVREITVKSCSMAMGVPTPGFLMVSLFNPVGPDGKPLLPGEPHATLQTHLCLLPNQMRTFTHYAAFFVISLVLLGLRAFLVPILHLEPFAMEPAWRGAPSSLPLYGTKARSDKGLHAQTTAWSSMARRASSAAAGGGSARWTAKRNASARRWGWAGDEAFGPRIVLDDDFYDDGKRDKAIRGARRALTLLWRETWTTWRVIWMTVLFWAYLARER